MVNPPFQSPQAQPESGVRGNVPAPFGAGERLQSPTYRYLGGSNPPRLPDPRRHLLVPLQGLDHVVGHFRQSRIRP